MARTGNPNTSEHAATLRQLKLLVLVLVLSNVGLGVFSFYLLRRLDRQYSDLIERSVPVLTDLQELTAQAVAAMLATNPAGKAFAADRRAASGEDGRRVIARDREVRAKLLKSGGLPAGDKEREMLRVAGDEFSLRAEAVLARASEGRLAEALQMREELLRPAFDRYVLAATKAADGLESVSLRANRAMSDSTSSMSSVVLGLASWPIILLLGILLLTAVFVLVLMVLFRGREMSDMP